MRQAFYYYVVSAIVAVMLHNCSTSSKGSVTRHSYIQVAGSKIYYESRGKGETIVLLHGGYLDRRMWERQVDVFATNYHVITCDLRGHGATIDGDSSYFMHEAIRQLLDSLQVRKATVAGLSLGAMVATDFAIENPQYTERLLLITPGLNKLDTSFAEDSMMRKYSALMQDALVNRHDTSLAAEYFIRSWFDGPYRLSSEADSTERKKALDMAIATMKNHKLSFWPRLAEPPAIKRLHQISCPVLIITAEKDNFRISKNAEAISMGIPQAKIVTIRATAHMPNMEKPDEFNKLVMEFMRSK